MNSHDDVTMFVCSLLFCAIFLPMPFCRWCFFCSISLSFRHDTVIYAHYALPRRFSFYICYFHATLLILRHITPLFIIIYWCRLRYVVSHSFPLSLPSFTVTIHCLLFRVNRIVTWEHRITQSSVRQRRTLFTWHIRQDMSYLPRHPPTRTQCHLFIMSTPSFGQHYLPPRVRTPGYSQYVTPYNVALFHVTLPFSVLSITAFLATTVSSTMLFPFFTSLFPLFSFFIYHYTFPCHHHCLCMGLQ